MIRHYFHMAIRNMSKQRMFAAINVGGFALGIAACLLIALYIRHEWSYDTQNPQGDQVYRIVGKASMNGVEHTGTSFPAPMSLALENDFPEIEKTGRIMASSLFGGAGANQIRRADQVEDQYENGFCFADQSILDILHIPIVAGDKNKALTAPFSMVISKSVADKYFPHENPIGKVMFFNDFTRMPITVGAVMEDFSATSHLQFRFFISLAGVSFWDGEQKDWKASNYGVYVLLKPGVKIQQLQEKMTADVLNKYMIPALEAAGRKDSRKNLKGAHLYLQALKDIHLHSYDIEEDVAKKGDIRIIWLFGAIAFFILVLAVINFLNLSTARSANRAKEVGLRKVIGSSRRSLIKQFLTESILHSFFSFLLGVGIAYFLLPLFSKMSGVTLSIPWLQWWFLAGLFLSAIVTGLAAGVYPAFYLSAFRPIDVLKGPLSGGSKNALLRGVLVVFQFAASLVLLIGTLVIYRQMQFILHRKIGFSKDQVVMIQGTNTLNQHIASFKSDLQRLPGIASVTVSDFLPIAGSKRNFNLFYLEGKTKEEGGVHAQNWVVDHDYIPTLGMTIVAGRNFSKDLKTDSQAVIINKAMADQIGCKNPVGKVITNGNNYTIIGVVDNFNFESVKQAIDPLCMFLGHSNNVISVRTTAVSMDDAIAAIRGVWKGYLPHQTMRYDFLDESYAAMYADVQRTGLIFTSFAVLAMIIACLGLFALAAFMAEQRSKEISIRKVLGASVSNVFTLLTANFLKLILTALLIAVPVGWFFMQRWLQDYTYRISITWDIFAISAISVIFIAILTIGWQAAKAALSNPAERLRAQ